MTNYYQLLAAADDKLCQSVLEILAHHRGKDFLISRNDLVMKVRHAGHNRIDERPVRDAIKQLRRKGYLICAVAGTGGGYYLASNRKEYDEFRQAEYAGKIKDMAETMHAMDQSADMKFGRGSMQERLL
jgi:hypothetical protein